MSRESIPTLDSILIKGFIRNTFLDWEGKISSVIFLPNCNWRCLYCHAKKLVQASHELETISFDTVYNFLKEKKDWIDGIVICGGEPLLYKEISEFIKKFKDLGLQVKLDTNGAFPEILKGLIDNKLIDYIAMDIKAPLNKKKYKNITARDVDTDIIKKTIDIIMSSGIDYEFRTTVSKKWISHKDILDIARDIKGAKKYYLQKFRYVPEEIMDSSIPAVIPNDFTPDELEGAAKEAGEFVKFCAVR